jgi:hypothetical protein
MKKLALGSAIGIMAVMLSAKLLSGELSEFY